VRLDTPEVVSYLEDTVRVWLGLPAASDVPVPQLPEALARRFLRVEEVENEHRDQWGCWEYGACEAFRRGALWEPEVDRWLAERRAELAGRTELEPLWPDGKRFAVSLSHDVDLLSDTVTPGQALRGLRASLGPPQGGGLGQLVRLARPGVRAARTLRHGIGRAPAAELLELALGIEQEHGVTATYFFTVYPDGPSRFDCLYLPGDRCSFRGETVRIGDVLRAVAADGFDVGLHGSYRSALEPGRLAHERAVLEEATGLDVRTTRQHFIHWHVKVTPRLQAEAGLTADSSLGFNRNLGFRCGTALPFRQLDVERGAPLDLLEVPLVVHDGPLLRADGLELDTDLAREAMRQLIDAVAETRGVATLLFHPNNLERAEFLELFRFGIEHGLAAGGWFASLRQIERWWRKREARILAR